MVDKRIVLVEKDGKVNENYRLLLEKEPDMKVIAETDSVESAIQLSETLKPDVVIVDSNLVDLKDNRQLFQCIAKMPGVKVLVTSFHSDSRFVLRMLHAGASGYMLKDRAHEELVSAVRTIIAHQTYISTGIAGISKEE